IGPPTLTGFVGTGYATARRGEILMTSLNISLPEPLRVFVDAQVAEGRYATAEECIQQLIREDAKRRARDKVDALLLEGLNDGEPIPVTPAYWEAKEQQLVQRHGNAEEE